MTKHSLDSNDEFLDCIGGPIRVWKVKPGLYSKHWTKITELKPNSDELLISKSAIDVSRLKKLAEKLKKCSCAINREGYIYMFKYIYDTRLSCRVDDFCELSEYLNISVTRETVWNKVLVDSKEVVVDLVKMEGLLEEYKKKLEKKEEEIKRLKKQIPVDKTGNSNEDTIAVKIRS